MLIKGIIDEDFVNYKKPSMYIASSKCSFKCDKECGRAVCQNSELAHQKTHSIGIRTLVKRYLTNPITKAIVVAGMEPFDTPELLYDIVLGFRDIGVMDDIVIYTGYTEEELTLRPLTFDEYVGQSEIKENLRVFIGAARKREEILRL